MEGSLSSGNCRGDCLEPLRPINALRELTVYPLFLALGRHTSHIVSSFGINKRNK